MVLKPVPVMVIVSPAATLGGEMALMVGVMHCQKPTSNSVLSSPRVYKQQHTVRQL